MYAVGYFCVYGHRACAFGSRVPLLELVSPVPIASLSVPLSVGPEGGAIAVLLKNFGMFFELGGDLRTTGHSPGGQDGMYRQAVRFDSRGTGLPALFRFKKRRTLRFHCGQDRVLFLAFELL